MPVITTAPKKAGISMDDRSGAQSPWEKRFRFLLGEDQSIYEDQNIYSDIVIIERDKENQDLFNAVGAEHANALDIRWGPAVSDSAQADEIPIRKHIESRILDVTLERDTENRKVFEAVGAEEANALTIRWKPFVTDSKQAVENPIEDNIEISYLYNEKWSEWSTHGESSDAYPIFAERLRLNKGKWSEWRTHEKTSDEYPLLADYLYDNELYRRAADLSIPVAPDSALYTALVKKCPEFESPPPEVTSYDLHAKMEDWKDVVDFVPRSTAELADEPKHYDFKWDDSNVEIRNSIVGHPNTRITRFQRIDPRSFLATPVNAPPGAPADFVIRMTDNRIGFGAVRKVFAVGGPIPESFLPEEIREKLRATWGKQQEVLDKEEPFFGQYSRESDVSAEEKLRGYVPSKFQNEEPKERERLIAEEKRIVAAEHNVARNRRGIATMEILDAASGGDQKCDALCRAFERKKTYATVAANSKDAEDQALQSCLADYFSANNAINPKTSPDWAYAFTRGPLLRSGAESIAVDCQEGPHYISLWNPALSGYSQRSITNRLKKKGVGTITSCRVRRLDDDELDVEQSPRKLSVEMKHDDPALSRWPTFEKICEGHDALTL